jgi:preprotein translocase subunit YajC
MLITPAYAQGLGGFDLNGTLGNLSQFMPLVLIFVVFYFLLIRPQQQKQKELRRALSELKRGDRVVTGGGILGTVRNVPTSLDRNGKSVASSEIEVEIAPNIRVTVMRETITSVIKTTPANDAKPAAKAKAS